MKDQSRNLESRKLKWGLPLWISVFCFLFSAFAFGQNTTNWSTGGQWKTGGQWTTVPSAGGSLPDTNVTSGLVGWWNFEEGSGTNAADSVRGNTGTFTNGVSWVAGKIGTGAVLLDGVGGQIIFKTNCVALSADFTATVWIKYTSVAVIYLQCIWGGVGGNVAFTPQNTTSILIHDNSAAGATITLTSTFVTNQWILLTVVRDTTNRLNVYFNGTNATSGLYTNSGAFTFSRVGSRGNGSFFNGAVDDARIYNRALTAAEIAALYIWRP
jgi:hypothetical protein